MFKHEVHFSGAYDLRRQVPSKNYGIHNMELQFWCIGPAGGISLRFYTHWYLPAQRTHRIIEELMKPRGVDLTIHAHAPQYEDHPPIANCKLTGGDCYCDGSSLYAEKWEEGFVAGGTEWLWPKLEEEYRFRFENGPAPDLTPQPRRHPDE